MSVKAMSAVFDHSQSIGCTRLVLLAMADAAHESGMLNHYPRSQSLLAAKAKVNERTVRRAIEELKAMGELEVIDSGDGRKSSDYRILLPGLPNEGGQHALPARATDPASEGNTPTQVGQDAHPIIPSLPVLAPSLPLVAASPSAKAPREPRINELEARELTREAWARRKHPPGTKFIGVMRVVEGFLDVGRTRAELSAALVEVPAFTQHCIEYALSQQSKQGGQMSADEMAARWANA